MYKLYQHKYDKRIFADRQYEYIAKYNILNENNMIILINIPAEDIENSKSWILMEDIDNFDVSNCCGSKVIILAKGIEKYKCSKCNDICIPSSF